MIVQGVLMLATLCLMHILCQRHNLEHMDTEIDNNEIYDAKIFVFFDCVLQRECIFLSLPFFD